MSDASARWRTIRSGLLLLLAGVAGYLNAVSYLGLGRVFTANMTGNTVLLGLALVQADRPAALRAGLALAGFLLGSACGACPPARDVVWRWGAAERFALWPADTCAAQCPSTAYAPPHWASGHPGYPFADSQ
jgi:hypothetical protein